jgi:hypothetical protein
MAQGGNGVVVPGCPACKKRIQTMAQFLDHLCSDVLPAALDNLSSSRDNESNATQDSADTSAANSRSVCQPLDKAFAG